MQTMDMTPTGPAAFGVIAERFRRAGQPEKAVVLCREGLEKFPDHLSARVTLGWSLLDMGEHQEAFDQLKRVLKRAPDNLAAIRGLAELHERGIGLVFDSLSEPEPEPEAAADIDPALDGDLDPIMEPEESVVTVAESHGFEIEDVIEEAHPGSMFDLSSVLDDEPAPVPAVPVFQAAPVPAFEPEPDRVRRPVSMYERAPLALRDDADTERVGELHDWLSRVRDRRSDSVSQYMAG
jgi:tetratricopeptide (TPR) repeat protein